MHVGLTYFHNPADVCMVYLKASSKIQDSYNNHFVCSHELRCYMIIQGFQHRDSILRTQTERQERKAHTDFDVKRS